MNLVERYLDKTYINKQNIEANFHFRFIGKGRKDSIEFAAAMIHRMLCGKSSSEKKDIIRYILENKAKIYETEIYRNRPTSIGVTTENLAVWLLMDLEEILIDVSILDFVLLLALQKKKWKSIREKFSG